MSSIFLSFGLFFWIPSLSILRIAQSILQTGLPKCLFLWWDFSCRAWFSRSSERFSNFFFHLCLFYSVHFQYFPDLWFAFSLRVLRFSGFGSSIPSVVLFFVYTLFFVISMTHFFVINFILIILRVFHTSVSWWSFTSDSKSPQVFRNLFSILAGLNNAVVWMVSAHPPIFKSSSLWRSFQWNTIS